MSDHDELPGFSDSGDPREEALWEAYQAMLRRRNEPRARWSAPGEPLLHLTPERATTPWPSAHHPLPAGSRAVDAHVATPPPGRAPRAGSGRTAAGRWVAVGSTLVLAVGAALAIVLWSRGPATPPGRTPLTGTPPAAGPPSGASPSESVPAPIAPLAPQPSADALPKPYASPGLPSAPGATPPSTAAPRLARTRRAALEHGGQSARGSTAEVSPRRASTLAVRDFYNALSRGDGARAEAAVAPEERGEGPLSASELTRYYSSLLTPLRVTKIDPIDDDKVFVRYNFVTADNHVCLGSAVVETTPHGGRALVSGIHVFHAC
jgi:hypothetical protein